MWRFRYVCMVVHMVAQVWGNSSLLSEIMGGDRDPACCRSREGVAEAGLWEWR